jgi:hypothetical protein
MPLQQFGEYRPDVSDYQGVATRNIHNVVPRGDGYGPFNSLDAISEALADQCRGAFVAYKTDGSLAIFAATSSRLWLMSNTDYSWTPVSKVATFTVTIADPGVLTLSSHGFTAGDPFVPFTTDTLPTGLTAGTKYYVKEVLTADTFTVSATVGGDAIETTGSQSGTHSLTWFYTEISDDKNWNFRQFGSTVIAVQGNTAPQAFDIASSSAFANLGGSPPQAGNVEIVGRFVVLTDLTSNRYRVQWSGLNAITTWDGTNSSDYQDFSDGGIVLGAAGGESGLIFQERAVRRMTYVPGSPLVFQIERILQDDGVYGAGSIVRAGEKVFFYSTTGFRAVEPGGVPTIIGREKVDRTFFSDLDRGNLQLFNGAPDPRGTRVFWAYKSSNGQENQFDKILCYDWALQRWSIVSQMGEFLLTMAQPGTTLENIDNIAASVDALAGSLDDYPTSTTPELAAFTTSHELGFFRGDYLEATAETSEIGTDGRRIRVRGFRPITDAETCYGSVSSRENLRAAATAGTESTINSTTGRCDMVVSTRYSRMKVRIPSGENWTFMAGVEPDIVQEGYR